MVKHRLMPYAGVKGGRGPALLLHRQVITRRGVGEAHKGTLEVISPQDRGIRLPHIIRKTRTTSAAEQLSGHLACRGPGWQVGRKGGRDMACSKIGWLPSPVRLDELAESRETRDGPRSMA
jgi:hypothetical protein